MIRIHDITLGQFAARDSWIHKLDPRTKLLVCLYLMVLIMLWKNWLYLSIFSGWAIAMYPAAKLSAGLAFRNIRPFFWLFALTLTLHALFTPGRILLDLPLSLEVTHEGISQGIFYTLRLTDLILLTVLLTLTTSPMALTDAFESFLRPFRRMGVPSHEIAMMLSIAIRFIPILLEESDRIRKAQISRGSRIEGHLLHKIQGIVPLIIPLFVSTLRRANDLAMAMESRCYRGSGNRTQYQQLRFHFSDCAVFLLVSSSGITLFWN